MFLAAILTATLMEVRNYNKRAAEEAEAELDSDEDECLTDNEG